MGKAELMLAHMGCGKPIDGGTCGASAICPTCAARHAATIQRLTRWTQERIEALAELDELEEKLELGQVPAVSRLLRREQRVVDFVSAIISNPAIDPFHLAEGDIVDQAYQFAVALERKMTHEELKDCGHGMPVGSCPTCMARRKAVEADLAAQDMERGRCPHGNLPHDCPACDVAGDLAFDAAREARCFR